MAAQACDLDVEVEWAGEGGIAAVPDALGARLNAAGAAIDPNQLQRIPVLLVVGETEEAERIAIAGDALNEYVVVLARGVVGAGDAFLAVDLLGEVVVSAGIGARPVERDLLLWPARVEVAPLRHG